MFQNVFIIGATGNIGRELISQIYDRQDTDGVIHENPTRIVGLACSSSMLYLPQGVPEAQARAFRSDGRKYDCLKHLTDFVSKSEDKIIFVDATAEKDQMTQFHLQVIRNSHHGIVTANKNPLALSNYETFQELTSQVNRYGYRCSVMAGAEAVTIMRDLKDLGDLPVKIEGIFSGTLGYICSELERKRAFSDIVKDAKKAGYTEPNPADDLNGGDVAKKMLILARTAGYNINYEDIELSPFIPAEYLEEDPKSFLDRLKELESYFAQKVSSAIKQRNVLRYVARLNLNHGKASISVGLEEIPKDSPLGSTQNLMNKVIITSKTHNTDAPYIVEAPGAGREVTAQNIRRDMLDQISRRVSAKESNPL